MIHRLVHVFSFRLTASVRRCVNVTPWHCIRCLDSHDSGLVPHCTNRSFPGKYLDEIGWPHFCGMEVEHTWSFARFLLIFFFPRSINISRVVFLPAPKWPSTYAVTFCADKSLLQRTNTKYIIMSHRSSRTSENRQRLKENIHTGICTMMFRYQDHTDFHRLKSLWCKSCPYRGPIESDPDYARPTRLATVRKWREARRAGFYRRRLLRQRLSSVAYFWRPFLVLRARTRVDFGRLGTFDFHCYIHSPLSRVGDNDGGSGLFVHECGNCRPFNVKWER